MIFVSLRRLKDLIKIHDNDGALMPKYDKRRFKGKYLAGDYLACLLDILRENFDGDFEKVTDVLKYEANLTKKKGFTSRT